ncbi:MAG TPA: hypothetical protein VMP03_07905, partial [Methylomirabilota bacterium]|nr:hypothetical protein [Methylomirabilota bacterium]
MTYTDPPPPKRSSNTTTVLAVLAAIVILVILYFVFWGGNEPATLEGPEVVPETTTTPDLPEPGVDVTPEEPAPPPVE